MKKYFMLFALVGLFSSCDKLDELTKFDMDYDQRVVIPSTTGVDLPFEVFTPEKETNSSAEFEVNDTRKDLIEEIVLKKLVMTVEAPEGEDFSFLESIIIYMSAEDLPEIKIAWNEDVSATAGEQLELVTTAEDLKEYIKKDTYTLRLKTVTDEFLSSDYEINIATTFFVDAKILGL
ncbi:hypothetical protein [Arenibacter sp. ARW7G5Y1]|uniref:hypothetical protein n=1 Tax=Arenibacter sp. ARW7G5Y1 TaxID=2135619 RepID=UPI000D761C4A|nr:hypothetical protein [Arenibacter sp. ARW7G5Y1]PXX31623.1 hypothetical protein C7972_101461 [Arenibacter sp. ARW7G5Y1]|tara:strand:+ start:6043 stop:6573 length:531 start_codon:yes stop_codon:yes gene_type:complete